MMSAKKTGIGFLFEFYSTLLGFKKYEGSICLFEFGNSKS